MAAAAGGTILTPGFLIWAETLLSCWSSRLRRQHHSPWNVKAVLLDARLPGQVTLVTVRTTVSVVIATRCLNNRNIHPQLNAEKIPVEQMYALHCMNKFNCCCNIALAIKQWHSKTDPQSRNSKGRSDETEMQSRKEKCTERTSLDSRLERKLRIQQSRW